MGRVIHDMAMVGSLDVLLVFLGVFCGVFFNILLVGGFNHHRKNSAHGLMDEFPDEFGSCGNIFVKRVA